MSNERNNSFPSQCLPMSKKTTEWRKKCVDWCDNKTFTTSSLIRRNVAHKRINYDLLNGKVHMSDMKKILNPNMTDAGYISETITHYPILNNRLDVLRGEELSRVFDWKVVVTNPNSISEVEEAKKEELLSRLQQIVENQQASIQQTGADIDAIDDYMNHEWQDVRELRANQLLNHYNKEQNFQLTFNCGFMDALAVSEEIYQCDIVGGEPVLTKLNPEKVRIFKSGFSNRVEDADIIILEDYWSPGKIIDTYYDKLSQKDIKAIDDMPNSVGDAGVDEMDNIDERFGFINGNMLSESFEDGMYFDPFNGDISPSLLPYDLEGNIRVIKIFWKSKRKVKRIKTYDPTTGEENYDIMPEDYVCKPELGEEEQIYWINQAWEGVKIGKDIYVNMGPRPIQYNSISNPSRCHFGIVGSIYNLNDNKPYSLVDMMKPFSYLYDAIADRLNKLMAENWGKIVTMDMAKKPKSWDIDKWMYFARVHKLAVVDSFNEGNHGAATGKLAGALNNASSGVIDADFGNNIQQYINILYFIKNEMSEVGGLSAQRLGQISNRETVGGVERATLQSSHITEWLFAVHDDVKKRALECFIETAKIALKGRNKKFQYIMSDNTLKSVDIDGDEFSEHDYGLVVDNSNGLQQLNQKIEMLAQAALQNQALTFSSVMQLYSSASLSEKQRIISINEKKMQERAAQQAQAEQQARQEEMQQRAMLEQQKMAFQDELNKRDNETRIAVAQINAEAEKERFALKFGQEGQDNQEQESYEEWQKRDIEEKKRQFDNKMEMEQKKLNETIRSNKANEKLKAQSAKRVKS